MSHEKPHWRQNCPIGGHLNFFRGGNEKLQKNVSFFFKNAYSKKSSQSSVDAIAINIMAHSRTAGLLVLLGIQTQAARLYVAPHGSNCIHLGPVGSTWVHLNPIWSTWVDLGWLGSFFVQFCPLLSTLVHLVPPGFT